MTYALVAADSLDADQTRVLRTIYEGGYTADRRTPWDQVFGTRRSSADALALMRDEQPVGLALVYTVSDGGTVVARYLVIDGAQRGRALGSLLWQRLTAFVARRGFQRLVWDVAHPDEPPAESGEANAQPRRIGLYERVGGALQPVGEYASPGGGIRRVPMRLLATSLDGSTEAIDGWSLRRLALDAYAYRYELATGVRTARTTPTPTGNDGR